MAKKNANARSKRVAKKKKVANRLKNEHRNQSRSMKIESMKYSSGVESFRQIFMENAKNFYHSEKSFDYYLFK